MARAGWCSMILALAACGGDAASSSALHASPSDAGALPKDAATDPAMDSARDAGDAEIGLGSLVAAFLTEYAHEVHATCPCRVEQQSFASVEECEKRFGDAMSWIDCATRSFAPWDGPELHAVLRCNVERFQKRATCLEQHGCKPEEMNPCYDEPEQCPSWNGEELTPFFYNCVAPNE